MRRLQTEFIPVVGEHMQLTRGDSPLQRWFKQLVPTVNRQYSGASTQGYYVIGADGTGYVWDNFIPRIGNVLDRGLAAYRANPPRRANFADTEVKAAAPMEAPPGASVLRLHTRIRPLPPGAGEMNALLGLDYMWVLQDEVRTIATTTGEKPVPIPSTLAARLVIFHMVDNIRGQVWSWQPRDVSKAGFTARLLRTEGNLKTFAFAGDYAKKSSNPPNWNERGQEGRVEGEFTVDTATMKFTRFRAVADSTAWFDGRNNFPPPPGRYPLVTAIVEANDPIAQKVAPEMAATGNHYLRPQVAAR